MNFKLYAILTLFILLLSGCGGGSSSGTSSEENEQPPTEVVEGNIYVADQTFVVGQSIELILYSPDQSISNINWQQMEGDPVDLLATNTKVVSFTPLKSGDYNFSVTFNSNNATSQLTHTVTVEAGEKHIVARLGHAVVEQNKVSLRASIENTIHAQTLQWTQLMGPSVSLTNTNGQLAIYFDAPDVAKDELIQLQVSGELSDGSKVTDTVSLLVENKVTISSNAYFDEPIAIVEPFDKNSPYADTIVNCVYSNQLSSSCRLNTLPLIAQDTLSPSVDDIMSRVVVSHPWMGERFKAFLEQYDQNDDFKNLLRATTAIVISYDVRPSFYWAATGAIYLDPNYLWLTQAERDTINEAPDYRSGFGAELQFEMLWRYVKDNDYANQYFPLEQRVNRTSQDILFNLGYLLYHELAHANDFFPSTKWQQLSASTRVLDAALADNSQSDILDISYPLNSQEMKNLAQVRYAGANSTATQRSYLPNDIINLFEPDGAVYFYSYTSTREDYAMLFEELMMYSRYGLLRDIAITNNPSNGSSGSAYLVEWGQRGRVAEQQIEDRVVFASERVLPEFNARAALENLPSVKQLKTGTTWTESVILENPSPYSLSNELLKRSQQEFNHPVKTGLDFYHKPLPALEREQFN